jgi:predicted amidophosphoribosyltransferase
MSGPCAPNPRRSSDGASLGALVLGGRCPCGRSGIVPCPRCAATARPGGPGPTPSGLDLLVVGRVYEGITREVVARCKYRNERSAIDWLVEPVVTALLAHRSAFDGLTVTWAPTTDVRRRARGFDHATLLAAAIARSLGRGSRSTLRRLDARPQTGRDRPERLEGPRFVARTAVRGPVLVVDDVVTTGSTLTAAARALRAAGATTVIGACVARTDGARGRAEGHACSAPELRSDAQGAAR